MTKPHVTSLAFPMGASYAVWRTVYVPDRPYPRGLMLCWIVDVEVPERWTGCWFATAEEARLATEHVVNVGVDGVKCVAGVLFDGVP